MTYRANWFWQIKVTTVTSCLTGSKAVVELPLYQAGVQPGIRERLIGMFIKNAISLKIYFSNSKIIAVSLPGMKRRLSIFMPLFHLPVFWFGYFDGFKTLSRLCQQSRVPRNPCAVSLDSSTPLYKCHPGRTALVQPAPGGGVYSGEEEKVTCSERHSRDRRPSWGWRPAR